MAPGSKGRNPPEADSVFKTMLDKLISVLLYFARKLAQKLAWAAMGRTLPSRSR